VKKNVFITIGERYAAANTGYNFSSDTEKKEDVIDPAAVSPEKPLTHKLNTQWTLFWDCSYGGNTTDWEKNLKQLATISTVEEWWGMYRQIPKISLLPPNGNLSVFRQGLRPVPYDRINVEGGEYIVRNFEEGTCDDIWLRSVLFCIGEVSPKDYKLVVGTVLSVKKSGRVITMWITTTEQKDEKAVKRLGKFYKEQIGLGARKMRLPFKVHDKSEKKKDDEASTTTTTTTDESSEAVADAEPQP